MSQEITFWLNNKKITVYQAEEETLLIDFLHEELGLTGTKYSCGIGQCQGCKVAIRNEENAPLEPVLACYARIKSINKMHITTIEGIGSKEDLHPLQQSFIDDYSFQCGYSTPGFLMASYILMDQLEKRPIQKEKLDDEILKAINGHLCRCTGYVRYFDAIKSTLLQNDHLFIEEHAEAQLHTNMVNFVISKKSANDLKVKKLMGKFTAIGGEIIFDRFLDVTAVHANLTIDTNSIFTGIFIRDLNLKSFFFKKMPIHVSLDKIIPYQHNKYLVKNIWGEEVYFKTNLGIEFNGNRISTDDFIISMTHLKDQQILVKSKEMIVMNSKGLNFPYKVFRKEFGLEMLSEELLINFEVNLPYHVGHP